MIRSRLKCTFAFIGNLFEHYDSALFSLLIPFFSSKIFPSDSSAESLIKGFSLLPLTILTKPLGSLFFSWLSKIKSAEFSLKLSYIGMALVTMLIGFIPLDGSFVYAGYTLGIIRLLQGFFSSGETINGAMYVLEHSSDDQKGFFSGLFDASSLAGFLIASMSIAGFQTLGIMDSHWQYLFWLGGFAFIPSLAFKKPGPKSELKTKKTPIKKERAWLFIQTVIICGVSYAFFSLCFTFSNSLFPIVTKVSKQNLQNQTSILLAIDMLALPLFGLLAKRFPLERIMQLSLACASLIIPVSFGVLGYLNEPSILFIRLIWTLLGALFSANLYLFYNRLFPSSSDVFVLSMATSIGSCLIGQTFSSLATSIFVKTNSLLLVGLFFSIMAIAGLISLTKNSEKKSKLI